MPPALTFDAAQAINIVVGASLGALVSAGIGWYFAHKASSELKAETAKLSLLINILAQALKRPAPSTT
jgi:hypothetical protein